MLHKNVIENVGGFRMLNATEVNAVSGGADIIVTGTPDDPWVESVYLDDLLTVGMDFGDLSGDTTPNPFGDGAVGDGGGGNTTDVDVDINTEGNLEVTLGDGEDSVTFEFDLADLAVESITVNIDNETFVGTFDLSTQTANGTYNVDFGAGLTGNISFSLSSNEQKVEATLTINF